MNPEETTGPYTIISGDDLVFPNGKIVSNFPTSSQAVCNEIGDYLNVMATQGYELVGFVTRAVYDEQKQFYVFKKKPSKALATK